MKNFKSILESMQAIDNNGTWDSLIIDIQKEEICFSLAYEVVKNTLNAWYTESNDTHVKELINQFNELDYDDLQDDFDYVLALQTEEFTYLINFKECDDNGSIRMYDNKNGKLLSDNIHGFNSFMNDLESIKDEELDYIYLNDKIDIDTVFN